MTQPENQRRPFSWKTLSKEYVYADERLKVRKDQIKRPSGLTGTYTVVVKNDFVLIIPKIADKFYLIEQDRYPVQSRSLEFPEGSIDKDETPAQAATRELTEEVGIVSAKMTLLGHHWLANGHHTQGYYVFLAEQGETSQHKREDSEFDMETKILTESEIEQKIADGTIQDAPTIAALLLFKLREQRNE